MVYNDISSADPNDHARYLVAAGRIEGGGTQEESILRSTPMLYQQYYWATEFISQYGPWAGCLAYNSALMDDPNIKNYITSETIINQEFIKSTSYKVQDRYSDTVNVENNSIESLLDNTYQDLLILLSKNIL